MISVLPLAVSGVLLLSTNLLLAQGEPAKPEGTPEKKKTKKSATVLTLVNRRFQDHLEIPFVDDRVCWIFGNMAMVFNDGLE